MINQKITVGIVNYNGLNQLPETIASVKRQDYREMEIIVVDNKSTDGSRRWLDQRSDLRCIYLKDNIGSAGGRNVILRESRTAQVLLLDHDIVLAKDALRLLMKAMQDVPGAAACHAEIRDDNDPMAYHYNGGWNHFLCGLSLRKNPAEIRRRRQYEIFGVVSGAVLLVDRGVAAKVGFFDEDFFFNMEDGDFASRLTLSGFHCVNVPAAVAHHASKPRGTSKAYHQVRNRWYFIMKLYDLRTICLLLPFLVAFEIAQGLMLAQKGSLRAYLHGTKDAWLNRDKFLKKRKKFFHLKTKSDEHWLKAEDLYVPGHFMKHPVLRRLKTIFDGLCLLYWTLVKPMMRKAEQ